MTCFSKNLPKMLSANFCEKNENFWQIFWKNVKFLAIFWQSNGNFPVGQLYTPKCMYLVWVSFLHSKLLSWTSAKLTAVKKIDGLATMSEIYLAWTSSCIKTLLIGIMVTQSSVINTFVDNKLISQSNSSLRYLSTLNLADRTVYFQQTFHLSFLIILYKDPVSQFHWYLYIAWLHWLKVWLHEFHSVVLICLDDDWC